MVIDSYPLPIVGTETRVTDMNSDPLVGEYMYHFLVEEAEKLGRKEKLVGWYHSHPGFRCWLSKVDVETQNLCQKGGMGMIAVVIDPHETKASGKIDLGSFRCYPEKYLSTHSKNNANVEGPSNVLPKEKLLEFGACADKYYKIKTEYFTTSFQRRILDRLWNSFWIKTLSSSPIKENNEYSCKEIQSITDKITDFSLCQSKRGYESNENLIKLENLLNQRYFYIDHPFMGESVNRLG